MGFRWKLIGSKEDACREKLSSWIAHLGDRFDPEAAAADYLVGELLLVLSPEEAARYEQDRECWITYLSAPAAETATLRASRAVEADASGPGPGLSAP